MKRLFLILLPALALASCLNRTDKEQQQGIDPASVAVPRDTTKFTTVQWIDSLKSLGTIEAGQVLKISYRFKNTGSKPLVIERVQPGCGCTVADYPKAPIAPGAEGEIMASFDSNGKEGQQHKNITVYANIAEEMHTLWFDVMINKPKE